MDNEEVIDKLKMYKKLLSKYMKFDEMILFGSYAKVMLAKIAVVVKKVVAFFYKFLSSIFSKEFVSWLTS